MKLKVFLTLGLALLIMAFDFSAGAAQDGNGPQAGDAAAALLDSVISYQGVLYDGGQPVSGSRDMTFRLHSDSGCTVQVGADIVRTGVSVNNGLFSTELPVNAQDFNGQALWLSIEIGGTGLGCQRILPAPYALGLRPGVKIEASVEGSILSATNNRPGYGSMGLVGISSSSAGTGVGGYASSTTGGGVGVDGTSASSSGFGIYGYASSPTGVNYGVYGISDSVDGIGVYGQAADYGVYGKTTSNAAWARGVYGYASATSGQTVGVQGQVDSNANGARGVYGLASAAGGQTVGVYGRTESGDAWARGVYGYAPASVGQTVGVEGRVDSNTAWARGVYGYASATSGQTVGVLGQVDSNTAWALGVYGYASATSGQTVGVQGQVDSNTAWARGVYGYASATSGQTYGVIGQSDSTSGVGVWAYGRGGAGGIFVSYNGDLIQGWEETSVGGSQALRFKVQYDGDVYSDGSYHCGINDGGNATYVDENTGCMYDNSPADFAEMLPAVSALAPGDVLVIGPDGRLSLSTQPNQVNVAGVYSTRPSYLGNSQFADDPNYAPLAIVGVVPVKVCSENGEIKPGDLLTTSSLPGVAMKALPVDLGNGFFVYRPGTIIGKALQALQQASGVILVLIGVQ